MSCDLDSQALLTLKSWDGPGYEATCVNILAYDFAVCVCIFHNQMKKQQNKQKLDEMEAAMLAASEEVKSERNK